MLTYFGRHTKGLDVDQATRDMLWNERRIAIHFPENRDGTMGTEDNRSLDPQASYKTVKKPLGALVELARDGGYVCAQHVGHEESLVGKVSPGATIELISGMWGPGKYSGRTAILKSLRLDKVKLIPPFQAAVILVGQPRQGTFSRWPNARDVIQHLVEGTPIPRTLGSLSPDQQEILCSEFLRSDAAVKIGLPRLAHLLLPVGRTMKDLDIYGLDSSGRLLIAQVTHLSRNDVLGKLQQLLPYLSGADACGVLFCRHDRVERINGVVIVPIQLAFQEVADSTLGAAWLSAALLSDHGS